MFSPLDRFVPDPVFREDHKLRIGQPPEIVWMALKTLPVQDMPLVRILMGVRSLPTKSRATFAGDAQTMIDIMLKRGWFKLAEESGRFTVIGSIGQFWRLRPEAYRRSCRPEEFRTREDVGFAKSASAFQLIPDGGHTILRTETRVTTGSGRTRRKMSAYWRLIRPFSGLIRYPPRRRRPGRPTRQYQVTACRRTPQVAPTSPVTPSADTSWKRCFCSAHSTT